MSDKLQCDIHGDADKARMLAEMGTAESQVDAGHFIQHDEMKAWLLSWGTDHELPPPPCACGQDHELAEHPLVT